MAKKRVLIVEDELTQMRMLESVVSKADFDYETAATGLQAVNRLREKGKKPFDVILLDLVMPEMDGIEVLDEIRPEMPNLPVVMLTAHSSVRTVVDAMKAGANDFIVKPASAERIRSALQAAIRTAGLVGEIAPVQEKLGKSGFKGLIGNSKPMRDSIRLAMKAAASKIPVLVEGESGVGKEVFAQAIHNASDRANKPFVAVNCGAIPENLVESILFGHEKGAFTGATEKRIGKFQEADGGTLFLDEVGELPLDVQVKLLRAIQEREIDPVGGKESIKVNIRIISATNRNLQERVEEGAFREDLLYRLNVFPILLPGLRDRKEDIPALTQHFLEQIAAMEGQPVASISPDAQFLLNNYCWPGNVRQLQNAIFRAIILSDGQELSIKDFPHISLAENEGTDTVSPSSNSNVVALNAAALSKATCPSLLLENEEGDIRSLEELEAEIIAAALHKYQGRMSEVARKLGIGRSTLYRKVEHYNLQEAAQ
ncbi:sigma-54-dependent Fis family transcriptional regulator [Kordiimonas sediminis]|uniref:DNA-binding transcriptional regulator NtrC n=1 Tax=Kordiimonas sediminis TaxID=1735581 RepID=A0A919AXM1_9PROT|nr:sigma-54 dependent transcriptional regulator [Kordiimonas sediminis]GHF30006.1 sigma-54-dependent Fis family transcriptional regulator [Kordiimonas sediminis]